MRALRCFVLCGELTRRGHACYGMAPLEHKDVLRRFTPDDAQPASVTEMLDQLERVERRIARWRLNKWEFRVPPLLRADVKERVMLQQDVLKHFCLTQAKWHADVERDMRCVAAASGIAVDEVRGKTRAWLQEEAAKLRWRGEVNKAKELRDAFLRLEACGARDHRLLERLCCVYAMALQGTFEDAFANTIVEDEQAHTHRVDESNPFVTLVQQIVATVPHIHYLCDFMGMRVGVGYRHSLGQFLRELLLLRRGSASGAADARPQRASDAAQGGRLLYHDASRQEVLFDFAESASRVGVDDGAYGLPDFLYIRGGDFYNLTIASDNHWLRNRQLPHARQLEGIARRGSFVLGLQPHQVRIRNLLLPPHYLDKDSLRRLLDVVLCVAPAEQHTLVPWLPMYSKELDGDDVDYSELAKTVNEEEWLTL